MNRLTYRTRISALLAMMIIAIASAGTSAMAAGDDKSLEQDIAILDRMSAAFRAIAKRVQPAVVQISTTVGAKEDKKDTRRPRPKIDPRDIPEPFREFFEDFGEQQEPQLQRGQGSGVIIDAQVGYILTNNHVVGVSGSKEDRDRVRLDVTLHGGRKVQASIVGQDPKTDIALVKIEENEMKLLKSSGLPLQAMPIGDSSKMEVGDWVLAIGAPFGLAETVTQGIISAKGRSGVGIVGIEDFIQTDAAINPGNSGGPLVNMHGELIGINTAIATSGLSRGYMGIGFAIPTELIKRLLPDLKEGREIVRGYLGVAIKDLKLEPGLGETYGLKEDRGVLVEDVQSDTPASKAGLKPDDIILSIDSEMIESAKQLQEIVSSSKPGKVLKLIVWRDAKQITISVTVEAQPEDFYTARYRARGGRGQERGEDSEQVKIDTVGMTVTKATPELAKKYNWDPDEVSGQLIVIEVEPLGEAGASRISVGDIIVSVQGKIVKTAAALKKELSAEALAKGVRLRVKGEYGSRSVLLRVAP